VDELVEEPAEEPLAGGNVTPGVVRVGDTVRRPAGPWTPAVHAVLTHLESVGYPHAPRSLGLDERGRHVVEHVPGEVADTFPPPRWPYREALVRIGRVVRSLHDALEGFVPPPDVRWNRVIPPDREELVVHHDLAPWNLVRGPGEVDGARLVVIDWDLVAPGTRLWDLSYAAHAFVPLAPGTRTARAAVGLCALADGYDLDEPGRRELAGLLARRTRSMYDLLRRGAAAGSQPWAGLWEAGHGRSWLADTAWIDEHEEDLRRALLDG